MNIKAHRENESLAHVLDPRAKIVFALLFLLSTMLAQGAGGITLVVATTLILTVACKMSPCEAASACRPLAPLLVFIAVFDVLFTEPGEGVCVLVQIGSLRLSETGIAYALSSICRMSCALIGSACLARTTGATPLCDGLRLIAKPLRYLGINVDAGIFALNATLRFAPLLVGELKRVKRAQASRCAQFETGPLSKRLAAYASVIAPLFVGAFRKSDTLAWAVASRSLHFPANHSCLRTYHLSGADGASIVAGCILFCTVCALRVYTG